MRYVAVVMIVVNVVCAVVNFDDQRWDRVLVDVTDVGQWFLVWTLIKQVDELTERRNLR